MSGVTVVLKGCVVLKLMIMFVFVCIAVFQATATREDPSSDAQEADEEEEEEGEELEEEEEAGLEDEGEVKKRRVTLVMVKRWASSLTKVRVHSVILNGCGPRVRVVSLEDWLEECI